MKPHRLSLLLMPLALAAFGCSGSDAPAQDTARSAWAQVPEPAAHTDHSSFFQASFEDGPAVTRACLDCHEDEAHDVMATQHWTWQGEEVVVPGHDEPMRIGKKNVINNFCIGVQSNWAACTTCHAGYGWEDETFDFEDATKVDCLVCHDQTGTYAKAGKTGGRVDPSVDLLAVARSVGRPTRTNCGTCHFNGGGGNAVKHGDLDATLTFPTERIDVHMGRHDLTCVDCHQTEDHRIPGRSISVSVSDTNRVACTECHAERPHTDDRLNAHVERVACQTCHIPHMAVEEPTKLTWDWSQAGQDLPIEDKHVYMKIKGRFTYGADVEPEYYWYNGTSTRYILGDEIDPSQPTRITSPLGDRDDPKAKIWPFKVHRGRQVYDAENRYFLVPNVHGPEGYWTKFDWDTALKNGSEVTGLDYSGSYDFAPTEMFWPLSHMVAPKETALQCQDCHGESGRLDWKALGYDHDPLGRPELEHMPVTLLDADGGAVAESGRPLSTAQTCAQCHDLEDEGFVAAHGYHRAVEPDALPPERRNLMVAGPRLPEAGSAEQMNCFLCHLSDADHDARNQAIASGAPEWSVAATVPGLVEATDAGWSWRAEALDDAGEALLPIGHVEPTACGACHGQVEPGRDPLVVRYGEQGAWTTETTGQVFSGQRLRRSGMNLADKDQKAEAWDVHAARLVACGDCHYTTARPDRLAGDVPDENAAEPGLRRRCESCHAVEGTHEWLPQASRHLGAVACEACHVPRVELAARERVDGTVVDLKGRPSIRYRGAEGDPRDGMSVLIEGYAPVLLERKTPGGAQKLTPHNLVSEWFWVDAEGKRVPRETLVEALQVDGRWRPEVLRGLDADGDGSLDRSELKLDAPAKVGTVALRLEAVGVARPRIDGEVRAYAIHHGVTHGRYVNRDCAVCHAQEGEAPSAFELADYLPGGVMPRALGDAAGTREAWTETEAGGLEYAPAQKPADARLSGGREK